MLYIALNGHLQSTCQGLEDTLYLVVLVCALRLDVQVHTGSIRQALEEMQEHLRGHLANLLPVELGIPYQPRTASEIQADHTQAIVHRQGIAITLYSPFVAQGQGKALAKSQGGILYGMMLVHVEVA